MSVGSVHVDIPCSVYNTPRRSIVDSGTTVLALPDWAHGNVTALLDLPIRDEADRQAFYYGEACAYFTKEAIDAMPNVTVTVASEIPGMQFDLPIAPRHYLRGAEDKYGDTCYSFSIL